MSLRILVVDDSLPMRQLMRQMLEDNGHQVVAEAENLKQTLAAYAAHKPDLVTLDLSLAQEDGFTVLRELRKADPGAKVLVISGNSQTRVVDQILKDGAAGFLEKPVSIERLMSTLARLGAAGQKRDLLELIKLGVERSAGRLETLSKTPWRMKIVSIAMGPEAKTVTPPPAGPAGHYGCFLSTAGAMFLVLFSKDAAAALARAFVSVAPGSEADVVGELANIAAGGVCAALGDASDTTLLLSAPDVFQGAGDSLFRQAAARFRSAGNDLVVTSYVQLVSSVLTCDATIVVLLDPSLAARFSPDKNEKKPL